MIEHFTNLFWDEDELIGTWAGEPGVILELDTSDMKRVLVDRFKEWLITHARNDGIADVTK